MLKLNHGLAGSLQVPSYQSVPTQTDACENRVVMQDSDSSLKALVFTARLNGRCVAVKDYSASHPLLRATICRWLLAREVAAMKRLAGHPGVPALAGEYGKFGFAMELIEGQPPTSKNLNNNAQLLQQIESHVKHMHLAGVTHNDIRKRNLLVDQNERVFIIDFASAMVRSRNSLSFASPLYFLTRFSERVKIVKLKLNYRPDSLRPDDLRFARYVGVSKRLSRLWKRYIYRFLK